MAMEMTTKEAIHQLVDTLDEKAAVIVLDYVRAVAHKNRAANGQGAIPGAKSRPIEWMKIGKPTSEDDPLWNLVGIVGDEYDGPTDIAANHDKYLAEAYADLHEDDDVSGEEPPAFTLDAPLWRLVGIGRTEEPTDIAEDKDDC
jgi:hypothetical protein